MAAAQALPGEHPWLVRDVDRDVTLEAPLLLLLLLLLIATTSTSTSTTTTTTTNDNNNDNNDNDDDNSNDNNDHEKWRPAAGDPEGGKVTTSPRAEQLRTSTY